MVKVHITDIEWGLDGVRAGLTTRYDMEITDEEYERGKSNNDLDEVIVDKLSEEFKCRVESFAFDCFRFEDDAPRDSDVTEDDMLDRIGRAYEGGEFGSVRFNHGILFLDDGVGGTWQVLVRKC